jgi:RNA polymerase sigma-70 factor, ECF subfamily
VSDQRYHPLKENREWRELTIQTNEIKKFAPFAHSRHSHFSSIHPTIIPASNAQRDDPIAFGRRSCYNTGEMSSQTNEDWLRALNQPGEPQREALEKLRDYLFRVILVYVRDHGRHILELPPSEIRQFAEDMAQEALLSVRANLDSFRGESKFTTWAYRFAINQVASELRLRRYTAVSLEEIVEQKEGLFAELYRDQEAFDPELEAERRVLLDLLKRIIHEELSDRQRQAIIAVHLRGYSMDEVAELLHTNRNSLYKVLHDARQKIKSRLLAYHLSEGDILALFERNT